MRIVGMLRIRNEERWIADVIRSIQFCNHVYIMDDHSTDATVSICRRFRRRVTLWPSPFEGLDEARDKDWLLDKILENDDPDWILLIDGDEVLAEGDDEIIKAHCQAGKRPAFHLQILYLWNQPDQIRVDGVYGRFTRPSLFKPWRGQRFFKRQKDWNGNLHCSSVPEDVLSQAGRCPARILHYGYMDRETRLKKWRWYNQVDPGNQREDYYLHMIIGDVPELPPETKRRLAGPLRLREL